MTRDTRTPVVFIAIASIIIGAIVYGIAYWIFKDSRKDAFSVGLLAVLASFFGELLRPLFEKKFNKKPRP